MNLMFRKNFGADKGPGGGGGVGSDRSAPGYGAGAGPSAVGVGGVGLGGTRLGGRGAGGVGGRGPVRRSREFGYYPMDELPTHPLRTHLFLTPPTGGSAAAAAEEPERLGPGPRRNSGGPLIRWGGASSGPAGNPNKRKQSGVHPKEPEEPATPTASRQVSFSANRSSGTYTPLVTSGSSPPRSEPISLATLDRDCFIIPLASLERFLPAGVPHAPIADKKRSGSPLSVLEVEDPKQCVLAHFMTPLEPLDPLVESPISRPLVLQRDTAAELLAEIASSASQSILLTNMERNADFPFISYYLINKQNTDPVDFYQEVQCATLKKFDPRDLRYAANHTLDLFNEVATIARPPLEPPGGRPPIPSTGYIVSIFKVFEGDDGLKFEQNWLYWTGARMMYRYLPKSVGLRRITLHKSMSQGDKMYLLICECSQLQDNLSAAAILLPALRARLCGYTGLYRPSVCF
ncbi:uncharacterized protein LOC105695876 isoform X1 [Orussus abietinus]|uniref:uncharacterized protein LOC105695876 isoform X1 n=1 Tax=Orussus abietinus TaxID=222816 RepID=UPI000C715A83|nr:uncharacterized protein LOC105695876 isoform X1 [Orussus abietinus]XP_023287992.1 uncharacterized protein LOC105695876 isoform X1 [Orussus abietinus]XP_023287993.1 uncharacterized protein LOC105695876 isoform X1 [Orussus abietinus]XP_023287994.1 uncharacterized protein LOC105695876 isoform X1 [Orussus abietinus]XP_023287995.1 uncharacterized protein LOC105695876 isoform X1 [Orussus abietinus]XP_023287996.1 uncharacterized protein LOC105695876 isoform X1 [Orussus abietinus]XP_023287997.1 un